MECEDRRCERMEKSVLNNKLSPVNYRSRLSLPGVSCG
jgi:hypothetical protein